MLPTFPSRYWSTIGLPGVFSLAGWSPRIRTGFLVPRPTQVLQSMHARCPYGTVTLCGRNFQIRSGSCMLSLLGALQPRHVLERTGLGSAPFARHYSGYRLFLSLPQGTKMFQFPWFAPSIRMVTGLQPAGLPHSDVRGSFPVCRSPRLFAAYHVLPRLRKPRHPPFALISFPFLAAITAAINQRN